MAPGEYDYEVEGGDCLPLNILLRDGNGDQLNLLGYSSTLSITWPRNNSLILYSGDRLEMVESGDSPEGDSPAGDPGRIVGSLTGAETNNLPYGRQTKYEWSVTQPNGCKLTFLKGYIIRT